MRKLFFRKGDFRSPMPGMGQATPPVAGGPEPCPSSEQNHQQVGRKLP